MPTVHSPSFSDHDSALEKLLEESAQDRSLIVADMAYGNPQRMASDELIQIYQKHCIPKNDKYYAYKTNVPEAQVALDQRQCEFQKNSPGPLKEKPFRAGDITMTTGAVAALNSAITVVVNNPQDEVVFLQPKWFVYLWTND